VGSGNAAGTSTSLVGLVAVDKSVYLLRNRQALTADDFLAAQADATRIGSGKLSLTSEDVFDRAGIVLITDGHTHFADDTNAGLYYPRGYGDGYGADGYNMYMPRMEMAMDVAAAGPVPAGAVQKTSSVSVDAADEDESSGGGYGTRL
jgi:hypothetical protein